MNADDVALLSASPMALHDKNLYAYCDNNPVTRRDTEGDFWNLAAGAIIGAAIGGGTEMVFQALEGNFDLESIAVAAIGGALSGAFAATGIRVKGQMIANAAINGISELYNQKDNIRNKEWGKVFTNVGEAIGIGAVSGYIGGSGYKAKNSAYSNLMSEKDSLFRGYVSNGYKKPNSYKKAVNKWIDKSRSVVRNELKKTTVAFTAAAFSGTAMNRSRQSYFRQQMLY